MKRSLLLQSMILFVVFVVPFTVAIDSTNPSDYFFYENMNTGSWNTNIIHTSLSIVNTTSVYEGNASLQVGYTSNTCSEYLNISVFTQYNSSYCLDMAVLYTNAGGANQEVGFMGGSWANNVISMNYNSGASSAYITYINGSYTSITPAAGINVWRNVTVCYQAGYSGAGSTIAQIYVAGKNYANITTPRSYLNQICLINRLSTGIAQFDLIRVWNFTKYGATPPQAGGVPTISNIICQSCNAPYGDNSSPYTSADTTPTFNFTTDMIALCRIGIQDLNHTGMGLTRNCTSGENATTHICTLTTQDALTTPTAYVYLACKNGLSGNESSNSNSGPLLINGVATTPQAAIDYGIQTSVIWPQATVYSNQQVFLRDVNNNQILATVDRVVVYGNQRWLFNYNNFTRLELFNITPVVYSLELANMTNQQIESNVTTFINGTKQ